MAILFIILILALCLAKDTAHNIRTHAKRKRENRTETHESETADKFKELTEFIELIDEDETKGE